MQSAGAATFRIGVNATLTQSGGTFTTGYGVKVAFSGTIGTRYSLFSDDTAATLSHAGPVTVGGSATLGGTAFLTAKISPTALATGDSNNYAPTDFATATVIRLTGDGAKWVGAHRLGGRRGGANGLACQYRDGGRYLAEERERGLDGRESLHAAERDEHYAARQRSPAPLYDTVTSRWLILSYKGAA